MARKNTRNSDNAELFVFDQRTKAVMAQAQTDVNSIKEKVQSVREVVPGRSNNEIVLVLQYYDNDVAQAIQAFLEDGAKEALQEWRHQPGNKPASRKKKRNKSKGPKADAGSGSQGNLADAETEQRVPSIIKTDNNSATKKPLVNGHVDNDKTPATTNRSQPTAPRSGPGSRAPGVKDTPSDSPRPQRSPRGKPTSLSLKPDPVTKETRNAALPASDSQGNSTSKRDVKETQPQQRPHTLDVNRNQIVRDRTQSEASTTSTSSKKPLAGEDNFDEENLPGLEKSTKDLLRQTLALQRLKSTLNDEVERSFKNISKVFEDLRKQINDREAELMYELDKVKIQATEVMTSRQKRAAELKQMTDRSPNMSEAEVAELRADIKLFVSDRKVDEDLGSTQRFTCDLTNMGNEIKNFGSVTEVKHAYRQRRSSVSSLSSSIVSHDDLQSPFTPLSMSNPFSPSSSFSSQPPQIAAVSNSSARVVGQSESLTRYEVNELQNRLAGISVKDKPTAQAPRKTGTGNKPGDKRGGKKQPDKSNKKEEKTEELTQEEIDAKEDAGKSRNAKRRQKQRERQKEQRRSNQSDLSETESEQSVSPPAKGQGKGQGQRVNKPNQRNDDQSKPGQKPAENQRGQGRRTPSPQKRRPQDKVQGQVKDAGREGSPAPKPKGNNPRNRNKNKGEPKPAQNGSLQAENGDVTKLEPKNEKKEQKEEVLAPQNDDKPASPPEKSEKTESPAPEEGGDTSQPRVNGKAVTVSVKSETKPPKTAEVSALGDFSTTDKVDVNANTQINGSVSDQEGALPQRKPRSRGNRRNDKKELTNGENHSAVNGDINSNSEIIPSQSDA